MRLPSRLTPLRYLAAVLRARPRLAAAACVLGSVSYLPGALLPLLIGDTIAAIGDHRPVAVQISLIALLGVLQAAFGAASVFAGHTMWIHGAAATQSVVAEHTARLGASLRTQATTGDVMALSSSDINHVGNVFEVGGRFFGSVVAFLTIGITLLFVSPLLGAVAMVGVPVAVLSMGKLIEPLQRRKGAQREELST